MTAPVASRVVVADDGFEISLTWYAAGERLAVAVVDPLRAIGLAGDLIAAAIRRFDAALSPHANLSPQRRRGGDPRRGKRAARDEAACDFARLLGADLSLEQRAAAIIGKVERYQPATSDPEGSAERQALYRIASTGLPLPGRRQLRRIIAVAAGHPGHALAKQKIPLDGQDAPPVAEP